VLRITKEWVALETIKAAERITLLAEKSRDLTLLGDSGAAQSFSAWAAGEVTAAGVLADRALELALLQRRPTTLALRYLLQIMVRYWRGDLAGAEYYFTIGLKFFDEPGFRRNPLGGAIGAFYYGAHNAWALERTELARMRLARMMAAVNRNSPHDLAISAHFAASLHICLGEYEEAAALAAQALEISEKNQFLNEAAMERLVLGEARAWLGSATEGIALMREGIAGMLEFGQRLGIAIQGARMAELQARAGFVTDALDTMEQALRQQSDEPIFRPEILRIRGELQHRQGQTEMADSDFHEAITIAQRMGAKAWELRATMSLARLLAQQGKRAKAHVMLAKTYCSFKDGYATVDLKEAKTLLEELAS
jgi:tetratricopeptide (TPR) repeat protein